MKNRIAVLLLFVAVFLIVLWNPGPFEDLKNRSADGPLFTMPSDSASPRDGVVGGEESAPPAVDATTPSEGNQSFREEGVKYNKETLDTPDGPVLIHTLEIDLKIPNVIVKPVSSHQTLFGYEYLSVMARNVNALAAVNGGFTYPNGLPGGMVYSNKILKTPASGRLPVLFLMEGQAVISDAQQSISLKSGQLVLKPVFFNQFSIYQGLYVFTPVYGSTDRIEKPHMCAVVKDGVITDVIYTDKAREIPDDGFLVSAVGTYFEDKLKNFIKPGAPLECQTELKTAIPLDSEYLSAYECGSWIIKDGADVCPESDPWALGLKSREPRTAVGIKADGTLLFMVVDGRSEATSIGATGHELAQLLLKRGVNQAALLDGGASSEMIVGGKIMNNPSAGRERLLSSCFAVFSK